MNTLTKLKTAEMSSFQGHTSYCPFDVTRKDVFFFFTWRFILNEHILFLLIITICLFCFCDLCSKINPKIVTTNSFALNHDKNLQIY